MVALTPAFPVVRDKAVLHQSGPVNFSAAFLAQQYAAFGNNPADEFNRMTRYELGKIAHHDPLSAFGTVSETFTFKPDPTKIEFGQSSVTDSFGDGGKAATTHMVDIGGEEVKRGKSLAQDVADLRSGALTADDLPIHVFQYVDLDGDSHWVTENNRALTVLRMAKLNPTKIHVLKKSDLEKKLDRKLDYCLEMLRTPSCQLWAPQRSWRKDCAANTSPATCFHQTLAH